MDDEDVDLPLVVDVIFVDFDVIVVDFVVDVVFGEEVVFFVVGDLVVGDVVVIFVVFSFGICIGLSSQKPLDMFFEVTSKHALQKARRT